VRSVALPAVSAIFVALPDAAAYAQAGKVYRIGFLREGQPPESYIDAFQQGLRELGYADGRNVVIEYRIGSLSELPECA
jgi:putative ABC transport system substrate-binding protein